VRDASVAAANSVARLSMPILPLWRSRLVQERRHHISRRLRVLQHDGVAWVMASSRWNVGAASCTAAWASTGP
jgi:hypothetical protein